MKDAAAKICMKFGDKEIKLSLVGAFKNAFDNLSIWRGAVYCFEEFYVMIDVKGRMKGWL